MEIIENINAWREKYQDWQGQSRFSKGDELGSDYPFVENRRAPFKSARSALPMLNLALISSAGAYLDGMEPFAVDVPGGDAGFREIPTEIEAADLKYVARGYTPKAVLADMNAQIPLQRLFRV
ncbi:MAG: hypothetical protein WKF84_14525 [Pyrinomonadaceae bacterium]